MAEDNPTTKAEIKAWLLRLRVDAKLSQREAAERADVSEKTVGNWERGDGGLPQGAEFLRYLRALDVKIEPAPPVERRQSASDKLDELIAYLRPPALSTDNAAAVGGRQEIVEVVAQLKKNRIQEQALVAKILELASAPDSAVWRERPQVSIEG